CRGLRREDPGSKNGTYVNSCSVTIARLREGDTVRLGDVRFKAVRRSAIERSTSHISQTVVKQVDTIHIPGFERALISDEESTNTASVDVFHGNSHHLAILFSLSRLLQEHQDPDAMLKAISEHLMMLLGGDSAAILMYNDAGELHQRAACYRTHDAQTFVLSPSIVHQVLTERCAIIAPHIPPNGSEGWEGPVLAVPIIIGLNIQGLLYVCQRQPRSKFSEADLDLLFIAASILGPALRNMELAQQRERHLAELEFAHDQLLATQERLIHTEKLALLGQFASGILHEVQNHLSPLALADFIAHEYPEAEDIQEMAELVIEARERIMELVSEMRYFASGQAPEPDLERRELGQLTDNVIRFSRHDARLQHVSITFDIREPALVLVDDGRIRQVLINLLCNAADAITGDEGQIDVSVVREDTHATLHIKDNGSGIPLPIQSRIFQPFFSTKGEGGLGLGLDICLRIVQEHGGTLTFVSTPGVGTTFKLSLPLHSEAK
ncbi:MAG: ATP-binding protein, partial [Myxococcota bacterium]